MRICYVDEAGCTGTLPAANSPVQPVCVIAGAVFNYADLRAITFDFLNLKRHFFPGIRIRIGNPPVMQIPPLFLDWVLAEVGGCDVRTSLRNLNRNRRRHAIGFLDRFMDFLHNHDARIMGRLLVKPIGPIINGRSLYTSAIQTIFTTFQNYLQNVNDIGTVILDSRTKPLNVNVAHSLFTQKYQAGGDPYPRIVEMPTFGLSENHVGIQTIDLICSGLLFPMATESYCTGHVNNVHVHANYAVLRQRYGLRLRAMQHRYQDAGHWRGGIVVNDGILQRSGAQLFV
jgi:hypothetical protein